MINKKIIQGSIKQDSKKIVQGSIRRHSKVIGKIVHPIITNADTYDGSYNVTPVFQEQQLNTKNKNLSDNIIVHAIPYYEVENESDGKTVIIGG